MAAKIYDFAVIGAGMAGASLGSELAQHASAAVLEAEDMPGYHATGRSAAFWEECYGGPELVPLTLGSGGFLRDNGFLNQRGALYIGRQQDGAQIDSFLDRFSSSGATIERLSAEQLANKVPMLRSEWCDAIWEPACADIDVAGLHAHFLKQFKQAGGDLLTRARLQSAQFDGDCWTLVGGGQEIRAKVLVNAAGAWADEVAQIAGVKPIGITPLRRTVVQLRVTPTAPHDLPLVLDIGGQFYFKPENGRLWLSPHDEVPSPPCDAAPEELAVAEAIERLMAVVDIEVEQVERKWAGLRSFAPDRLPVYGRDRARPEFFWFAGQGGSGIQTSPAAARMASQMLLGLPVDQVTQNLQKDTYSPTRFG
ncbi:MAG: FAD-dependent oxidoreductase [Erythrobacter sp.]